MVDRIGTGVVWVLRWFTYLFLIAPIVMVIIASFTAAGYNSFPPEGFSLRWYEALINNDAFMTSAGLSLLLATGTALVSTSLGTAAAIALVRFRFRGSGAVSLMLLGPLILPGVVLGVALLTFYSSVGVVGNPLWILFAHVMITLPYTTFMVSTALSGVDPNLELAAMNLGASRIRAFWRVVFPSIGAGLASALALSFVVSFDEIVLTIFISGPGSVTLPVRMYTYIEQSSSPLINAVGVALILLAVVVFAVIEKTVGMSKVFGPGARDGVK